MHRLCLARYLHYSKSVGETYLGWFEAGRVNDRQSQLARTLA